MTAFDHTTHPSSEESRSSEDTPSRQRQVEAWVEQRRELAPEAFADLAKNEPCTDDLPPGLVSAIGILGSDATQDEIEQWTLWSEQEPAWAAHMEQLQTEIQRDASLINDELQALFSRGEALSADVPPAPSLSELFDDALFDAHTCGVELAAVSSAVGEDPMRDSSVDVSVGAPAFGEQKTFSSTGEERSWFGWHRSGRLAASLGLMVALVALWWGGLLPGSGGEMGLSRDAGKAFRGQLYAPSLSPDGWTASPKGLLAPDATSPEVQTDRVDLSGLLQIRFFLRQREGIREVHEVTQARPGDELRFFYRFQAPSLGERVYLLLFMVDQRGQWSHLYPVDPQKRFVLKRHKGAFLPTGATLDSIAGAERIFACVSRQPLSYPRAKAAVRSAMKARKLRDIHRLSLPCVYQRSWLLVEAP